MNLSLEILTDLLIPNDLSPDQNFLDNHIIYFSQFPQLHIINNIRLQLGNNINFVEAAADEMQRLIRYWRAELAPEIEDTYLEEVFDETDLNDLSSDAPVIKLVNHLFARALDLNASDIHFEPEATSFVVRCRVDGIMNQIESLPLTAILPVISRLKLMAKLDIGEKRLPQDGRIDYKLNTKQLDLRVSTLPGVHGESVVLRILDRSDVMVELSHMGMPENVLNKYQKLIEQPHGMILVTGPTGSGKTTTLYATLEKINSSEKKIITVEDPVEYQLDGITQIHVNSKIGLNFSSGLRSIVRQDPDTIMIGEIRDQETASIAIESALTGHLVFSTLHTNDAAGAITRLQDMGIEPYLLSSSLLGIQAQRLVRRICPKCKQEKALTTIEANLLNIDLAEINKSYYGKGCQSCGNTGYRGRIGLYELLVISDSLRRLINTGADASEIRNHAVEEGMITLRLDAIEKLKSGVTTPEEVLRVTKAV